MNNCEQTKGLSIMEHGISVNNYFHDLRNHILFNQDLKYEWRLPDWIYNIELWNNLEAIEDINQYHIYHDCGKPYCIEYDELGRKHFPNHSNISYDIWKSLENPEIQCLLIKHDMDIHTLKMENFKDFSDLPFCTTLLITGFCEIHSNASMFGGIESTSFKIKWKKIDKIGRKINDLINKK